MYKIIFETKATNFFKKLDKNIQEKIAKKIELLKTNPDLGKPLSANLKGFRRIRIDKYRIIYQIRNQKLIILVLDIGHRKNIY